MISFPPCDPDKAFVPNQQIGISSYFSIISTTETGSWYRAWWLTRTLSGKRVHLRYTRAPSLNRSRAYLPGTTRYLTRTPRKW